MAGLNAGYKICMTDQPPLAVFLHGSIGVGKSTFGTSLAAHLGGVYVDGDQYQQRERPWFASSLTVARALADAAIQKSSSVSPVVLGYPLRCTDHVYLRTRLARAGVRSFFVNLAPPLAAILAHDRGRELSAWERQRTAQMIEQGYNGRPWTDARVDTSGSPEESLHMLVTLVLGVRCRDGAA